MCVHIYLFYFFFAFSSPRADYYYWSSTERATTFCAQHTQTHTNLAEGGGRRSAAIRFLFPRPVRALFKGRVESSEKETLRKTTWNVVLLPLWTACKWRAWLRRLVVTEMKWIVAVVVAVRRKTREEDQGRMEATILLLSHFHRAPFMKKRITKELVGPLLMLLPPVVLN